MSIVKEARRRASRTCIDEYPPDEVVAITNYDEELDMLVSASTTYFMCTDGSVWDWVNNRWLGTFWKGNRKYVTGKWNFSLIKKVAETFIPNPNPKEKLFAVPIDGDFGNCSVENVIWSYFKRFLIGKTFNRLTVVDEGLNGMVKCLCECGNIGMYCANDIKRSHTTSCGCYATDVRTTHGCSDHPAYWRLKDIIRRCTDPEHISYPGYGGIGITVCKEWESIAKPEAFITWAMANGFTRDKRVHRLDNKGNYCPENCIILEDTTHTALHTHMRELGVDKLTRKEVEEFVASYE
jgi:hypothetical protein